MLELVIRGAIHVAILRRGLEDGMISRVIVRIGGCNLGHAKSSLNRELAGFCVAANIACVLFIVGKSLISSLKPKALQCVSITHIRTYSSSTSQSF